MRGLDPHIHPFFRKKMDCIGRSGYEPHSPSGLAITTT
jgi:hypothetical protein